MNTKLKTTHKLNQGRTAAVHSLRNNISHLSSIMGKKTRELTKSATKNSKRIVKEHPIATTGVVLALAVGTIIGWLMPRSKK